MMRVARLKQAKEKLRIQKSEAIGSKLTNALSSTPGPKVFLTLENVLQHRQKVSRQSAPSSKLERTSGNKLPWPFHRPLGTPGPAPSRTTPTANAFTKSASPKVKAAPPIQVNLGARKSSPPRKISLPPLHPTRDFATIPEIRRLLGITSDALRAPALRDIVFIAIDTEFERLASATDASKSVVEVGLSILDTRDLYDIPPGPFLRNWLPRMTHHSFVLSDGNCAALRQERSLFSSSSLLERSDARSTILQLLHDLPHQSHAKSKSSPHRRAPAHIILGQSILTDLAILSHPTCGFDLNLLAPAILPYPVDALLDTSHPALTQRGLRRSLPSGRLGPMLRLIGVDPAFGRARTLRGVHHAGNDAAYSLMAAALFALRWGEVSRGKKVGVHRVREEDPVWRRAVMGPEVAVEGESVTAEAPAAVLERAQSMTGTGDPRGDVPKAGMERKREGQSWVAAVWDVVRRSLPA